MLIVLILIGLLCFMSKYRINKLEKYENSPNIYPQDNDQIILSVFDYLDYLNLSYNNLEDDELEILAMFRPLRGKTPEGSETDVTVFRNKIVIPEEFTTLYGDHLTELTDSGPDDFPKGKCYNLENFDKNDLQKLLRNMLDYEKQISAREIKHLEDLLEIYEKDKKDLEDVHTQRTTKKNELDNAYNTYYGPNSKFAENKAAIEEQKQRKQTADNYHSTWQPIWREGTEILEKAKEVKEDVKKCEHSWTNLRYQPNSWNYGWDWKRTAKAGPRFITYTWKSHY